MYSYDYDHNGILMDIHYTREAGEPEVHTELNGDPGTPGTDPAVTIHHIFITLKDKNKNDIQVDIYPILDEFDVYGNDLEDEINNEYER
jgi:hypothetical protein